MMEEGGGELWQEYRLLSHTNLGSNSQWFSNPYRPTEMHKKTCTRIFTATPFIVTPETTQMSVNNRLDNQPMMQSQSGVLWQ